MLWTGLPKWSYKLRQVTKGPVLFVGPWASLTAAIQWLAGKELAELQAMGGLVNNSLTIMETTNGQGPSVSFESV